MQDVVGMRLKAARKELLDLGLRNPLINFRQSKNKGLELTGEKAAAVYEKLVNEGRTLSFAPQPSSAGHHAQNGEGQPRDPAEPVRAADTRLQTTETEMTLQHKLLNTYYTARTGIEEQGVNTLFFAFGMMKWYESESSAEARLAPLLLVPVSLERSSARERFRIKYSLEEVGFNLSLEAKLKAEFGIRLPPFDDEGELSVDAYFAQVAEAVRAQPRWTVLGDTIVLGFFSFGKFLLFNDLDTDNWPDGMKPEAQPILHSLFANGFADSPSAFGDGSFIDSDTPADQLFQVIDADSSQLLALLAVQEGKNLVIQGPPGTGKSQTITNIIANAIGQGKKVLFVAEKMAALEVVKRRLDNIGLGEACLELHSHKANKKEFHQELSRVLELGKPALQKLQEEVTLLQRHKEELNSYSSAVNTPLAQSGLTVQQVYGYLLNIDRRTAGVSLLKIAFPQVDLWSAEKQRTAEAMATRIEARLVETGMPAAMLFWGVKRRFLLPQDLNVVAIALQKAALGVNRLQKTAEEAASLLGVVVPTNREGSLQLAALLQSAAANPGLHGLAIHRTEWETKYTDLQTLANSGKRLQDLQKKYTDLLLPEAWKMNWLRVREELKTAGGKWYRFLLGGFRNAVKQLRSVSNGQLPESNGERLVYVDELLEGQRLQAFLDDHEQGAQLLFGTRWAGRHSDWQAFATAIGYLHDVHQQIRLGKCPASFLHYLAGEPDSQKADASHKALLQVLGEHGRDMQAVVESLQLDEATRFQGGTLAHLPFAGQQTLLAAWSDRLPEVQLAVAWNNLADTAKEEGLQCLVDAATGWEEAGRYLKLAVQKTWYDHLLEGAMNDFPALRKFERATHEEIIRQFRRLDVVNFQYNRALAAKKHWEGLPEPSAGGQMNILKTEFNRKARHMPIRKLIQQAGLAIQAIKPVFMMSPLSIANFLPPGSLDFDLVIFDEASQVRPVEALGALLRGGQVVVVGDSKQLPPTAFFDTLNDQVDDDENVTADMESILGLFDAQGARRQMLRWHYRSRHESLIRVSNHAFYDDKLVVFPSPGTVQNMGVILHHLPHTAYDRGGSRTNEQEAGAVAEAVMQHARVHPAQSLGVVAFSAAQRQAIQDALEKKRRESPELESFFKPGIEEPFFVKNLENVQGDERDVIFISVGYGRTPNGSVSMSFGPLNNDGGEKRLNVLITRAKVRCEIFTNLLAADIDTGRTASSGLAALKSFLHFAEHGELANPVRSAGDGASPFEDNVAGELRKLGYDVRQQVGSSGFFLDMAIADPAHPGRYLLAIECDGASYHSARSARDRDRLRQQVLEGMGWRVHRIWSTDWFRHPARELKRVVEAIEKAKGSVHLPDDGTTAVTVEKGILREQNGEPDADVPMYQFATLPAEIGAKELHQHSIGKLAGWIEEVVKVEAPVHFDEMAKRVLEAAGIARMGTRIRSQLALATRFAEGGGKLRLRGDFLWHPTIDVPVIRNRTALSPASKKLKYVAPEEISLAVEKVVREAIAISPEAAVTYVARLFGFNRVTEEMREEILQVIYKNLSEQKLQREGQLLTV